MHVGKRKRHVWSREKSCFIFNKWLCNFYIIFKRYIPCNIRLVHVRHRNLILFVVLSVLRTLISIGQGGTLFVKPALLSATCKNIPGSKVQRKAQPELHSGAITSYPMIGRPAWRGDDHSHPAKRQCHRTGIGRTIPGGGKHTLSTSQTHGDWRKRAEWGKAATRV